MASSNRLLRPLALGAIGFALSLAVLQKPAPMFVNFGAGDDNFARGFRSGWERDGAAGAGATMFHWTRDGSRIELPLRILRGSPTARMRVARFIETPVTTSVWAHGQVLARFDSLPGGWTQATVPLTALRGPFSLLLRVQPEEGEKLGTALDWMEVDGISAALPRAHLFAQWALFFLGVPLLAAALFGAHGGVVAAASVALFGPAAVLCDRFGGLVAVGESAVPALFCTLVIAAAAAGLRRLGIDARAARPWALAACLACCTVLFQPGFYYPDVDTHARFVDAIARAPHTAIDPAPYQLRFKAWTRTVGDKTVAFPYSPVFHLLALPLRPLIGSVAAVKALAAASLGAGLLAVFALSALLGTVKHARFGAMLLFFTMPVVSSRLSLALYPALFAQALELLLAVFLVRWCGREHPARGALLAALFLVQAAYTGSLFTVSFFLLMLGAALTLSGQREKAARLLAVQAAAAFAVIAILYFRFVPVFLRDVLPAAGAATAEGSPWGRLFIFYGVVLPALSVLGVLGLRQAPQGALRVLIALFAAGLTLLALRYVVPGVFRDVKDVELLAGAVAVAAAAALAHLWDEGRSARVIACAALALLLMRGIASAVAAFGERFVAVGR